MALLSLNNKFWHAAQAYGTKPIGVNEMPGVAPNALVMERAQHVAQIAEKVDLQTVLAGPQHGCAVDHERLPPEQSGFPLVRA